MRKLLGQGWELSVFQDDAGLFMSIPVDSGFASRSFAFRISQLDLDALRRSEFRRKALEFILHDRLQRRMGGEGVEEEMRPVVNGVLHGSEGAIERLTAASPDPDFIRFRLREAGLAPR